MLMSFSEGMGEYDFINGDMRLTISVQSIMALHIKMIKMFI